MTKNPIESYEDYLWDTPTSHMENTKSEQRARGHLHGDENWRSQGKWDLPELGIKLVAHDWQADS